MEELLRDMPHLKALLEEGKSFENIADVVNTHVCSILIPEKRYDKAKRYLESCIQIAPTYSFPYLTMAEISLLQNQEEEALNWLKKAIQVQPDITYEIDTLECFASVRSNQGYLDLFFRDLKPQSVKSFYFLEIFYQIQGTTLQLFAVTGNADTIERLIRDELKTDAGFYTLLKYEKVIRVHCYMSGRKKGNLDMQPFLNIRIPDKLTSSFSGDGKPVIRDWKGNQIPSESEALYDILYGYNVEDEQEETVMFGDWKERLGILTGEIKEG